MISELKCQECGELMYVPRFKGRKRKDGHIKTMYCWKCKKITQHTESITGGEKK